MGALGGDEVMRLELHEWDQCPMKETPKSSLTPSATGGHGKKSADYDPGATKSADTLSLDFSASRSEK